MRYSIKKLRNIVDSETNEMPNLQINSQGDTVVLLQKMLLYFGYLTSDSLNGYYGSKTNIAVKNFQNDHGLLSDGVVNQETWQALIESLPV
ncbi:peptidoglycan-binding domain-containing protein [Calothrix sp. UHCC 0171]|uniref:peptidoglycan-binding domain-containing protein n=1 Tax=Calothrix sp. UHCC 0171 TaxID=3110245 RepID=UPI002B202E85|nr:peptidoglycan-binding domain-containing protein [Calothrix sp. UHCC 0171]MEA5572699.1 peptidoglycan-binding domain-containing protein [Calothrix sp. UHCC 0171]